MADDRRSPVPVVLAVTFVAALGALGFAVSSAQKLPDGPVPVTYNQESCAYCRMAIGEPAYAAQLQTTEGDVLDFDDPGCLMRYLSEHHPKVHAIWFASSRGGGWLNTDEVSFVPAEPTPMGWGLAAVRSEGQGLSFAAAVAQLERVKR